jgi:hypothetical protein
MKNKELAKIFHEVAGYLEMEEVPLKPYAYQNAAPTLETVKTDAENLHKADGLKVLSLASFRLAWDLCLLNSDSTPRKASITLYNPTVIGVVHDLS